MKKCLRNFHILWTKLHEPSSMTVIDHWVFCKLYYSLQYLNMEECLLFVVLLEMSIVSLIFGYTRCAKGIIMQMPFV